MSVLRDVWTDLVEKRLWPLAAVLVIALVAVPVVLAQGGGDQGAPPPAPATAPAGAPAATTPAAGSPGGAQVVSLADPATTAQAKPKGRYHDPFAGAVKAQEAQNAAPQNAAAASGHPGSTPGASSASSTSSSASGASSASSTSSAGSSGSAPSTSTAAKPATTPTRVKPRPVTHPAVAPRPTVPAGMRVDVTWGRAGSAKAMRDLVRLGRLDGSTGPVAMLFGVRADHKTAVFLLPNQVSAVGDGTCLPKPSDCQLLLLGAGESEFFDVTTDAGVTQYELDVDKVARRSAASDTAARRWRHRESKLGRKLLFSAIASGRTAAADFMYKSHLGVLVRQLPGR